MAAKKPESDSAESKSKASNLKAADNKKKTAAAAGSSNSKTGNGAGRPSVVPLTYPDKDSLQKAYMPFVKGGGLFLPTTNQYPMNEEVFLLVTLPDNKSPFPVPGAVVWQSPTGAMDGRRQGVGIEFKGREGNALRNRIEGLLGAKVSSSKATYTM